MSAKDTIALLHFDTGAGGQDRRGFSLAALRADGVSEADVLVCVKAALCGMIDAQAERLRAMVATAGAGQMAEYQQAEAEASDALAVAASGKAVSAASYPMLAASLGIDTDPETGAIATDVLGVARSVKQAADAFLRFGAALREARLGGKKSVNATATVEAACAAFDQVTWPAAA